MKILSSGVQRTEEEKVFTVVRNVDADSITTGMGVRYVGGAPAEDVSADGVQCTKNDNTDDLGMMQFVGIAAEDIPADGYGLVQNYGVVNSVYMSHEGSSITIGTFGGIVNTLLRPGGRTGTFTSAGDVVFTSIVPVQPVYNRVQIWETVAVSGQGWAKGFVRVL